MPVKKKSGGARKHGRNTAKGDKYRTLKKKEKSHLRRIKRHMEKYKDASSMVKKALEKYEELLRK